MIELPVEGKFSLEEVSRRGAGRYEELKAEIEPAHWNRYIAIDVETDDFEIADRSGDAMRAIHVRHPLGQAYIRKIGTEPEPGLAERIFGGGPHAAALDPNRLK